MWFSIISIVAAVQNVNKYLMIYICFLLFSFHASVVLLQAFILSAPLHEAQVAIRFHLPYAWNKERQLCFSNQHAVPDSGKDKK